jgi:hypothetical protein
MVVENICINTVVYIGLLLSSYSRMAIRKPVPRIEYHLKPETMRRPLSPRMSYNKLINILLRGTYSYPRLFIHIPAVLSAVCLSWLGRI